MIAFQEIDIMFTNVSNGLLDSGMNICSFRIIDFLLFVMKKDSII
jgi:hypothetical protein